MKIFDLLLMSISSLFKRKLRTVLTVLGVVIGITSIMVMISLGNGLKESTMEEIAQYSSITSIQVYKENRWDSSADDKLLDDDLIEQILAMEHVTGVYPRLEVQTIAKAGKYQCWINIKGICKEEMESKNFNFKYGSTPDSDTELQLVYGNTILTDFYNPKTYEYPYYDKGIVPNIDLENGKLYYIFDTDAYWSSQGDATVAKPKKIQIKTAGILAGEINEWNGEDSYSVYCDIDALKTQLKKIFKKKAIPGQPTRKNGKPYDKLFYSSLVVQVDKMDNVVELSNTISEMGYSAQNDAEWIESQTKQMNMIQGVLGAIGAVSLLVAAIGITNTMMMSIYERTKEIGVMKVLGCDIRNIQMLFLMEAGFIGIIGGTIGVLFSYGLAGLLNWAVLNTAAGSSLGFSGNICRIPFWLPISSIIFGMVIGMIAGFIPSLRAMRLSPLAAIRNE